MLLFGSIFFFFSMAGNIGVCMCGSEGLNSRCHVDRLGTVGTGTPVK